MNQQSYLSETIVVTGANGVLGSALVRELARAGAAKVVGLSRSSCDLLDTQATTALFADLKPTVVFHLAAWVAGVQGNALNAGRAFYENSLINLNVIEAARLAGVRKIVAAGTAAIYSDDIPLPMRESDLWQGKPHGSEQAYGNAKRAMLAQLEAYQLQYGLEFCYLICTNLYGERDRFDEKYGHVVPSLISRFDRSVRERADTIVIWGDGSPTRDFLYAGDAAAAFMLAAEHGSGCYNAATGRSITIRELVDTMAKVSGYSGEIVWDTTKLNGQLSRAYDVSRLRQLGWEPRTGLEEGLRKTAAWFRENEHILRR